MLLSSGQPRALQWLQIVERGSLSLLHLKLFLLLQKSIYWQDSMAELSGNRIRGGLVLIVRIGVALQVPLELSLSFVLDHRILESSLCVGRLKAGLGF